MTAGEFAGRVASVAAGLIGGGIRRFRILPGTFEVGAELTPTQKVRRDYVLAKYTSDVDALSCTPDLYEAKLRPDLVPPPAACLLTRKQWWCLSPRGCCLALLASAAS